MCNWLNDPENTWVIPPEGIGYKIFSYVPGQQRDQYHLRSLRDLDYYDVGDDGWVTWKEYDLGVGFCFFKTRRGALAALKRWHDIDNSQIKYSIRMIRYRNGKGGKHELNMFIEPPGIDIMIAGDFRLAFNGRYHL